MRSILGTFIGLLLWILMRGSLLLLRLPRFRRKQRSNASTSGFRVLITGRVDSQNWCMAHLLPLARATNISELLLVVDGNVSLVPKARQIVVPRLIGLFKPRAIVRSAWAVVAALREKPDIVMAYSLFPPGLCGLIAARLSGATAVLQLPGGPLEIESGGWVNDDIVVPPFLTRRLVPLCHRICDQFDSVIVRGRRADAYVRKFSHTHVEAIPGSVDPDRFLAKGQPRSIDIVFIGRIVAIKQPFHVCEVVRRVAALRPSLRVVVAGRGPLLDETKERARQMGLENVIHFAGHVEKVEELLTKSRIFLLTSKSEGLSIALAEAMTAGAVPVVANVGDLGELVFDGETGWLIESGDFDAYAKRIAHLLDNEGIRRNLANNGRQLVLRNNSLDAVTRRWENCLDSAMARRGVRLRDSNNKTDGAGSDSHEETVMAPAAPPLR